MPPARLTLRLLCLASALLALAACKEEAPPEGAIALPSGRHVVFQDVITNAPGPGGAAARFRFVAAGLSQDEDWSEDMQSLCETYAAPRVEGMVPAPRQVVISLADRDVPFGESSPDAVQFFEAYRLQDTSCIWEMY